MCLNKTKNIVKLDGTKVIGLKDKYGNEVHLLDKFRIPIGDWNIHLFQLRLKEKYGTLYLVEEVQVGDDTFSINWGVTKEIMKQCVKEEEK